MPIQKEPINNVQELYIETAGAGSRSNPKRGFEQACLCGGIVHGVLENLCSFEAVPGMQHFMRMSELQPAAEQSC